MTSSGNKSVERDNVERYIEDFGEFLEDKFYGHGDEEYGDGWEEVEPEYLLRRAEEEFYEFRQAVEHDQEEIEAIYELADLVNFGLMYVSRKKWEAIQDE